MPVWMIEYFGKEQLNDLFLLLVFMTAPCWLGMMIAPRNSIVRQVASPFILPILYLPVLVYLLFHFHGNALLPAIPTGTDFQSVKGFIIHPMAILSLFCTLQITFLTIGTLIYQKAIRCKMLVPLELLIAWVAGPAALIVFVGRLLLTGRKLNL